ncbi:hypothetical protein OC846_003304 [Tilletia horrida]|uniref:Cytochrome P450 n=1 Tax=Tilletia horrida TaxID=155126 RepID=A0AAN6JRV8_9BASI|nr:hypothetical protein OC845_002554 [Tilletia horrida]KAK0551434.1 hypothetical protein OC846_003304 [Tilletia horrida]
MAVLSQIVDTYTSLGVYRYVVLAPLLVILLPLSIALGLLVYFGSLIVRRVVERHVFGTDFYRFLPYPKLTSPWWPIVGNIDHIVKSPPADGHLDFMQEVGQPVFAYRFINYDARLVIADPVAVAYILSSAHSYDYVKPEQTRRFLANLLGEGLLTAEGDDHRRARRVLQPAFNLANIRNLTPIFFRFANMLSAKLAAKVDATEGPAPKSFLPGQSDLAAQHSQKQRPVIDVMYWLGLTTMDVIGVAGFGHEFHALERIEEDGLKKDVIANAFTTLMGASTDPGIFQFLLFVLSRYPAFQWVDKIPTRRQKVMKSTYKLLEKTSMEIINKKKADVLEEIRLAKGSTNGDAKTGATKEFFEELTDAGAPKDLIHLMLRANLADDLPDNLKLHDHELLGQITTLILAGQETTSTQLTWVLWTLAQPKNHKLQERLRREVRELFAGRDELRYDELQNANLLNKVTLEIMRLLAAVPSTTRVARTDGVVPLSKAYPRADGKGTFDRLPIKKGKEVFIFIQMMNRSPHIWGEDADEFNPDRWDDPPQAIKDLSSEVGAAGGAPSNGLWTFISGPRGCIGKAFAIAEFKAILAVLLRDLQFATVEGWEVERKQGIVLRPRIKDQKELGMQMPLYISRAP